jgi:hypothetical protein
VETARAERQHRHQHISGRRPHRAGTSGSCRPAFVQTQEVRTRPGCHRRLSSITTALFPVAIEFIDLRATGA